MRSIAAALLLLVACSDNEGLSGLELELTVTPRAIDFDTTPLGLQRTATLTIKNTGGAPLSALSAGISGDPQFAILSPPPDTIVAGQQLEVPLAFRATTLGSVSATLLVTAERVPSSSVALTAVAIAAPSCDDDNPCTDDTLELDASCTHTLFEGPCDDGNACTSEEVCFEGICLGLAVTCSPPAACFTALCDVEQGCVNISDSSVCDDGDPCTVDVCTTDGCTNDLAPDGTPCGAFVSCDVVNICIFGTCVEASVPDGAPCTDHNACTDDDVCSNGECLGTPTTQFAERLNFVPTFGGPGAFGTILGDGRPLIIDPLGGEQDAGAILTVFNRAGNRFEIDSQTYDQNLVALSRGSVVAIDNGSNFVVLNDFGRIFRYALSPNGPYIESSFSFLPEPASDRTQLRVHENFWYVCVIDGNEVLVLDAHDPSAPILVATLAAVECTGLAIDPSRDELLISRSAGGITRYSIADPLAPMLIDTAFDGQGTIVATNSTLIAVADPGPFAPSSLVTLLDPVDLSVRGTFDAGTGFFTEAFADLVFAGDRLFVQAKGELSVWDVSDPSAPVKTTAFERSGAGNGSDFPPLHPLTTDGKTLLRNADLVYGSVPMIFDVLTSTPNSLQHPARGSIHRLVKHNNLVYGLSRTGAHLLDASDPDSPRFAGGSTVPPFESDMIVWSLGLAAQPPRYVVGGATPGTYTSAYAALWRDGRDPSLPLVLSEIFTPFAGGVHHVADNGYRAVSLNIDYDDGAARMMVWDVDAWDHTALVEVVWPDRALELSSGSHDENYGTVAVSADRAVLVTVDPIDDPFDPLLEVRSTVYVADLTPSLIASAEVTGHVVSAAIFGDAVALMMKVSGGLCCGPAMGEVVNIYRVNGQTLELVWDWELEGTRVLQLTDERVAVAGPSGVFFAPFDPEVTYPFGDARMLEPADSLIEVGERVWVASPHGISVIRPPCPFPQ
jgi:hypothetical protein